MGGLILSKALGPFVWEQSHLWLSGFVIVIRRLVFMASVCLAIGVTGLVLNSY